jgi:hypothetical protein
MTTINERALWTPINERVLWALWNAAVDMGHVPAEAKDGTQALCIFNAVFMTVKKTEHGYDIDILNGSHFYAKYGDPKHTEVFALRYTKTPMRLE